MECQYTIKNVNDELLTFDYLMRESEKRKEICFLNTLSKEEIVKICKHYFAVKELAYSMGYEWENHTSIRVDHNELRVDFLRDNKNRWCLQYIKWGDNEKIQTKATVNECMSFGEEIFYLREELNLDLSWAYRSFIEAMELKQCKENK